MKCIVLKQNLHKALTLVLRTIQLKNDLPVLNNVLIEAKQGKLYLSGTNLELGVRTSIGGKIQTEGSITVPAKLFFEFISTLDSEKVELILKDKDFNVTGSYNQAKFTTIAASEFPPFPEREDKTFSIPADAVDKIATRVAFASSSDEGRPVLTGVEFKNADDNLIVAATDGFRLSIQKLQTKQTFPDTVIPAKTIQEVAKIVHDANLEELVLGTSKNANQLIFTLADTEVFSRLLEGEFPNYQRIIPTSSSTRVTFDHNLFMRSVKAAAIFARESANIVRLQIKKAMLVISANSPQIGEQKSELEAKVEGEENEIAFNHRFVLDFLNSTSDEEIVLEMTNALSPGLFKGKKDDSYIHIIMPVRVQGQEVGAGG